MPICTFQFSRQNAHTQPRTDLPRSDVPLVGRLVVVVDVVEDVLLARDRQRLQRHGALVQGTDRVLQRGLSSQVKRVLVLIVIKFQIQQ